jgi:hypothetical protein
VVRIVRRAVAGVTPRAEAADIQVEAAATDKIAGC